MTSLRPFAALAAAMLACALAVAQERDPKERDFVHRTTGTVRLRFVAPDLGGDSNVDAVVDDVSLYEFTCPGMVDGDLDQRTATMPTSPCCSSG